MSKLLSVSLTETAVAERRKTVTRRLGWWDDRNGRRLLAVGDRLTLCRKVMGRQRGEPLVRICEVEVVSLTRTPLSDEVEPGDAAREGFPDWTWEQFVIFFCHEMGCDPETMVTRIEWRYVDAEHGCIECDYTGLHAPMPDLIGEDAIEVERHDECATFDDDFEAAAFVALCHPQYDRLSYRTDDGDWVMLDPRQVTDDAYMADAPPIGYGEPVVLCTADLLTDEGTPP
jgi:hypothetical protein